MESLFAGDPSGPGHPKKRPAARVRFAIGLWLCAWLWGSFGGYAPLLADEGSDLDQRIAQLVKQLGDDEYNVRQRAQKELEKLGFSAFDALTDAEDSDDVEIAAQARYLTQLIRSHLINEQSPPEIRKILGKDYETQQDEAVRLARMQQLLDLPHDAGIEWLCRLLRFEQSPRLAKQTAILVITQEPQPSDADWPKRAATLSHNLERSKRPAALWLRSYVEMRNNPEKGLDDWVNLVAAERKTLEDHPQQTDSQVLMKMLRIETVQLERLGRNDEAKKAMHEMVAIERGESATLADLVSWLAKRHAWEVIDEVATRFASSFDAQPQLLYTLAQALSEEGKTQEAEDAANRALKINPTQAREHWNIARILQCRGLVEWSDRELRHIYSIKDVSWDLALLARAHLAESLHDRARDGEAAEVLQGGLDVLDSNPDLIRQARLHEEIEKRRARAYFYEACDAGQKRDFAKQRELLEKAIQEDPTEADVLIALYHLPDQTAEQKQRTLELIASAIQFCRNRIDEDPDKEEYYNQLAWLVANTEGDFDEAVRLSEKSIEIIINQQQQQHAQAKGDEALQQAAHLGGYYDTLAHCYAAKGDFAAAVAKQTEANRLIPYSQQISNKLAYFRSKLPTSEQKESP